MGGRAKDYGSPARRRRCPFSNPRLRLHLQVCRCRFGSESRHLPSLTRRSRCFPHAQARPSPPPPRRSVWVGAIASSGGFSSIGCCRACLSCPPKSARMPLAGFSPCRRTASPPRSRTRSAARPLQCWVTPILLRSSGRDHKPKCRWLAWSRPSIVRADRSSGSRGRPCPGRRFQDVAPPAGHRGGGRADLSAPACPLPAPHSARSFPSMRSAVRSYGPKARV